MDVLEVEIEEGSLDTENQRAIKPVLNTYGLNGGTIRPPRIAIEGAQLEKMLSSIEALKIPEMANWSRRN